ncbi:MAG: hypothetical protein ABIY52_17910, partial [Gemmatimonadaceae bacterium]
DEIEQLADDFLLPITGETLRSNLAAPGTYAGLELVGGGLKFSAAMPSQQAGWITLRCVNASDTEVRGEWRVGRAITEANTTRLDETILAPCVVSGNIIHFTAAPKELVTILARE